MSDYDEYEEEYPEDFSDKEGGGNEGEENGEGEGSEELEGKGNKKLKGERSEKSKGEKSKKSKSKSSGKTLEEQIEEDTSTRIGVLNPSDYARTGGFAGEDIGIARSGRFGDPYKTFMSQVRFKVKEMEDSEGTIEAAIFTSTKIPRKHLLLMNIDILVPALLYINLYDAINHKNLEDFLRKNKTINPFDLVRYTRYIKSIL